MEQGESPSRSKVEKRAEATEALTFGKWAEKYFAEAALAESTKAMRRSVYDRNLAADFGRLKLEEITPIRLMARCEKIKERGAAAPAVQVRRERVRCDRLRADHAASTSRSESRRAAAQGSVVPSTAACG